MIAIVNQLSGTSNAQTITSDVDADADVTED